MNAHRVVLVALATAVLLLAGPRAWSQDQPSRLTLDTAEHYLEQFEKEVQDAAGRPLQLTHAGREALTRIRDLRRKFPDHPRVKELFERAKVAYTASKGRRVEVTEEMLAYRTREAEIREAIRKLNVEAWEKMKTELESGGNMLVRTFPSPDPETVSLEEVQGKTVILEDFQWPADEFSHNGMSYTHVGSPAKGYYFVRTGGSRYFVGPYEAIKRFKRQVTTDVPDKWTVIGEIVGPQLMVPQTGKEKTIDAQLGWEVRPVAIYLEDRVLALFDADSEQAGHFAGEDRVQSMLEEGWSVRADEVADDIEPGQLVELIVTAVKEKNYELFQECIDPRLQQTDRQKAGIRQFWDIWQRSVANDYCHIEIQEVEDVEVLDPGDPGAAIGDEFADEFGDDFGDDFGDEGFGDDGADDEPEDEGPSAVEGRVERVKVWVIRFNERGTMFGSKKPVILMRSGSNPKGTRWYVVGGFPF